MNRFRVVCPRCTEAHEFEGETARQVTQQLEETCGHHISVNEPTA